MTDQTSSVFEQLKANVIANLYSSNPKDKSPKGSVDAPIRELVWLINQHPEYATLSSCSGRIAVFDPNNVTSVSSASSCCYPSKAALEISRGNSRSGKGGGTWLLSSHDPIELQNLLNVLKQGQLNTEQPLSFKHEPFLMHVACQSLSAAQKLLKLGLELGYRESGIVATSSKIVVALRSMGLALSVPLGFKNTLLYPGDEYLRELVDVANAKMQENHTKLKRLEQAELWKIKQLDNHDCSKHYSISFFPDLGLWQHAAVAFNLEKDIFDLVVFGGYGKGPDNQVIRRHSEVYCLRRHEDKSFDSNWRQITPLNSSFTSRQGHAAVLVSNHQALIFGGRASPANPNDQLWLYNHTDKALELVQNITGTIPSPRWGHTLTAIANGSILLTGGRDSTTAFDDMFILTIDDSTSESKFVWSKLATSLPQPLYNHSATVAFNSVFWVFGGLSEAPNDLLQVCNTSPTLVAWQIEETTQLKPLKVKFSLPSSIGSTLVSLKQGLLVLGGTIHANSAENPIKMLRIDHDDDNTNLLVTIQKLASEPISDVLTSSPLIHHASVALSDCEVVCLGGGVQAFSFGSLFAR